MSPELRDGLHVALLTAGRDRPYAFGLSTALLEEGARLDVIAGDDLSDTVLAGNPRVSLRALRREPPSGAGILAKTSGILRYYLALIRYVTIARPSVFHILWNNKFETFDRVFLMAFYRLLSKRIVLTAHNINTASRDGRDSALNRFTLRCQYHLCHHIFVHTDKMKQDLGWQFNVDPRRITVIPFGINNAVPDTSLTRGEARSRLGIGQTEKTILFFGNIAPYKGLHFLLDAFRKLGSVGSDYRLVIAGRPKQGVEGYWQSLESSLIPPNEGSRYTLRIGFIPDSDVETYFKAADVLVLPYTDISQSGVLFLGYSFGLPAIVADVGSLREDIVEGQTGFTYPPEDADGLYAALQRYFSSPLFAELPARRDQIRSFARDRYSWKQVAETTVQVYTRLAHGSSASHSVVSRPA